MGQTETVTHLLILTIARASLIPRPTAVIHGLGMRVLVCIHVRIMASYAMGNRCGVLKELAVGSV